MKDTNVDVDVDADADLNSNAKYHTTNINNKIFINNRLDYNHRQIVKMMLFMIQDMYDINPILIEKWLNTTYDDHIKQLDETCFKEVNEKYTKIFNRLNTISENFDDKLRWERDKCGYIEEECSNGYIKYCNKHRYLHNIKNTITHRFIEKKDNDIIEEQYMTIKYNMHVDYTRMVASRLTELFIQEVIHAYKTIKVSKDKIDGIMKWLLKNENDFKNKRLIDGQLVIYCKSEIPSL